MDTHLVVASVIESLSKEVLIEFPSEDGFASNATLTPEGVSLWLQRKAEKIRNS